MEEETFTNTHAGNRNWRRLVNANKELYAALPKFQKQLLSQSIVSAVTTQTPPGRFFQRDTNYSIVVECGRRERRLKKRPKRSAKEEFKLAMKI